MCDGGRERECVWERIGRREGSDLEGSRDMAERYVALPLALHVAIGLSGALRLYFVLFRYCYNTLTMGTSM
jgi:hypothetical protein